MTDLDEKLDELISKITARNKEIQTRKDSGPWAWLVAIVLSLISLVGIGVAMYYASRRAKELAAAKTQIEQDKVAQDQKAHEAKKETLLGKRNASLDELKKKEAEIFESEKKLKQAEEEHAARRKKIENLNAWSEINEG